MGDSAETAIGWERRGAFLVCARESLRPFEIRAADDLDDFDREKGTLRVDKTMQGTRLDARVAHTKNRTARVKEVWDEQLREWLDWRIGQATPAPRLRGEIGDSSGFFERRARSENLASCQNPIRADPLESGRDERPRFSG